MLFIEEILSVLKEISDAAAGGLTFAGISADTGPVKYQLKEMSVAMQIKQKPSLQQ